MFVIRSDKGYLLDHHSEDDDALSLAFADTAAAAMFIESETAAAIIAAFIGGDVVELANA